MANDRLRSQSTLSKCSENTTPTKCVSTVIRPKQRGVSFAWIEDILSEPIQPQFAIKEMDEHLSTPSKSSHPVTIPVARRSTEPDTFDTPPSHSSTSSPFSADCNLDLEQPMDASPLLCTIQSPVTPTHAPIPTTPVPMPSLGSPSSPFVEPACGSSRRISVPEPINLPRTASTESSRRASQPLMTRWHRSLSTMLADQEKKRIHRKLGRYHEQLQEAIEQRAMHAQNCLLAERNFLIRSAEGAIHVKQSPLSGHMGVYRKMQQLRLCRIRLQREIALHSIILLKIRRAEVCSLLDDQLGLSHESPLEMIVPIREIALASEKIQEWTRFDIILKVLHKQHEISWNSLSMTVKSGDDDRSLRVRSLLRNTHAMWCDSGISFHIFDESMQQTFNHLIMHDPLSRDGTLLKQVLHRIQEDRDGDALAQIVPFLTFFVDRLVTSHQIPKEDIPTLRLYVSRLLFPLIATKAFGASRRENSAADALVRKNLEWLRKCSESEMGIPLKFCSGTGQEYREASLILEDISFHIAPLDILNCLREAARTLFQKAKDIVDNQQARVDADTFFPIMVYCCVHADVWDMFTVCHYLNTFTSQQERLIEVGYYLTCLEGAAQYICETSPETFQHFNSESPSKSVSSRLKKIEFEMHVGTDASWP
eukprot:c9123_g1_i1.p1 GENE.c9123_g1_i1~~c9123_g1_i1.p1  ORF type:complete len:695 (+),score=171.77 c9123_g1_i1:135-2087(+)